jgi:hypothetical protein
MSSRLLIRGFGVRVPGGAPAKTRSFRALSWNGSWNEWPLLGYRSGMTGAGTGDIERLPSGSYRVHVYAGTDPMTGRAIRHRQTVKTQQQARIVLGRLLEQAANGRRPDSRVTVADVLARYLAVAELEPSTRETYGGYIRRWACQRRDRGHGRAGLDHRCRHRDPCRLPDRRGDLRDQGLPQAVVLTFRDAAGPLDTHAGRYSQGAGIRHRARQHPCRPRAVAA